MWLAYDWPAAKQCSGAPLPDFISTFEPTAALVYLTDVARLEAARTRAYHAADAAPLGADDLSAIDTDALGVLRIDLHPSLQIVRSAYPIVTIWAMNCGAQKLAPIDTWNAEDALVVRPHLDVEVRLSPPGGAAFLQALGEGRPLGAAADAPLADHPDLDLTGNLAGLIGWGLLRGVNRSESRRRQPS